MLTDQITVFCLHMFGCVPLRLHMCEEIKHFMWNMNTVYLFGQKYSFWKWKGNENVEIHNVMISTWPFWIYNEQIVFLCQLYGFVNTGKLLKNLM